MRVAEICGKSRTIPDLPRSALYELAAAKTPFEDREASNVSSLPARC